MEVPVWSNGREHFLALVQRVSVASFPNQCIHEKSIGLEMEAFQVCQTLCEILYKPCHVLSFLSYMWWVFLAPTLYPAFSRSYLYMSTFSFHDHLEGRNGIHFTQCFAHRAQGWLVSDSALIVATSASDSNSAFCIPAPHSVSSIMVISSPWKIVFLFLWLVLKSRSLTSHRKHRSPTLCDEVSKQWFV